MNKSIFLIEDDKDFALAIKHRLTSFGYEVQHIAETGEEAISILKKEHCDLIIMDMNLAGELDGVQTTIKLKTFKDTPVIFLSANTEPETIQRIQSTDAYGYIVKPVNPGELKANIEMALKSYTKEKELREMAFKDNLTGLYNRTGFYALVEKQIINAKRAKQPISFFYIDLDKLKYINDTFGHDEGDNAIINTAKILKDALRDCDIISRFGGDEFIVTSIVKRIEDNNRILKRIKEKLESFNQSKLAPYSILLSIGVSYIDHKENRSLEEVIKIADQDMYKQKKKKQ